MSKKLEDAISEIRKKYGAGAVMTAEDTPENIDVIPTGSFALDGLLGCGGLPKGRIIEAAGLESSGKSSLCLFLASQVQKSGGTVAYLDVENAYDRSYATAMGVDTDKILISQPATLEETMDIIRAYVETNSVDLIVVDSVAALTPKSELENEEEFLKDTMAVQARLMGKALRILTGPISRSKTVVIFINQLRDKIGVFYGEKTTTPGGKALKFYASVRLSVSKGEKILEGKDVQVGNVINITAVKNKVGVPFKKCTLTLLYASGIDLVGDTFDASVESEIITKSGNTYSYEEKKLGVGREQCIEALKKDASLCEAIRLATLAQRTSAR